jgi:hypothetical protein
MMRATGRVVRERGKEEEREHAKRQEASLAQV